MSSEYQLYYEGCQAALWAHPDREHCGCRGGGYFLSDLDTWHRCPYHYEPEKHTCFECGQEYEQDWHPQQHEYEWDIAEELGLDPNDPSNFVCPTCSGAKVETDRIVDRLLTEGERAMLCDEDDTDEIPF